MRCCVEINFADEVASEAKHDGANCAAAEVEWQPALARGDEEARASCVMLDLLRKDDSGSFHCGGVGKNIRDALTMVANFGVLEQQRRTGLGGHHFQHQHVPYHLREFRLKC
jgi:hypothetical protein